MITKISSLLHGSHTLNALAHESTSGDTNRIGVTVKLVGFHDMLRKFSSRDYHAEKPVAAVDSAKLPALI